MVATRDAVTRSPGDALRAWGLAAPTVRALLALLPAGSGGPGLRADASPAPACAFGGEWRVSVIRLISVTADGPALVGQVQVSEREGRRVLHYYAHDAVIPAPREHGEPDAWWLDVLAVHYARGGAPVDVSSGVPR